MPFNHNDGKTEPGFINQAAMLPAVLLILVQMMSGMQSLPQLSFFLLYLQEQMKWNPVTISSVVAGGQIAGMATALLGGAIAARLGSKWMLAVGLVISGLSSLVFQIHAPIPIVLLWCIGGAGTALITVGGATFLTRISARGSLGILAAFYALSMTIGGAIGNPLAGLLIERYGFPIFTWTAVIIMAAGILMVTLGMPNFHEKPSQPASLRSFWSGIFFTARRPNVRILVGLRSLPTIFYGMLSVLIPLLMNEQTGSKVMVAAYQTTNLIVASAAQLLAGRAADRYGARLPTLTAYGAVLISGLGLAASAGTVWGLFGFGVLGIAAAWALSTMMYIWVNDGVPKDEHPSTFGLLHAIWALSMIGGSLLGSGLVGLFTGLPFLVAGLLNIGSLFLILAYYGRMAVRGKEEFSL